MTEADLRKIELALNVTLPDAYRAALCPFPVRAFVGNTDTDLWDDADRLIELNLRLRREDAWPNHLYAVGSQDSVEYAIDLREPNSKLWWVDRGLEAPDSGPTHETFEIWSKTFIDDLRAGRYIDGIDPENDPPGTRPPPPDWKDALGCLAIAIPVAVVIATVISLVVFGIQSLFHK